MGAKMRLAAAAAALLFAFAATQVGAQLVSSESFFVDPTNTTGNVTFLSSCESRSESLTCPDPAILFYLYSGKAAEMELVNVSDPDWLQSSKYDAELPTVMLIHGYHGGDSLAPLVILKNAYIKQGTYNVIMLDWGTLAKVPCYVQTISNLKPVAKCVAHLLSYLDTAGVDTENITCVGHSLGAHVCGLIANYATKKIDKIVALDPARPLMSPRLPSSKLDAKDAKIVQVIHTNTGFYGLPGIVGTVDFCVNNGAQPFCEKTKNPQLCSHHHSVCFYAASLDVEHAVHGTPCTSRCPQRFGTAAQTPADPIGTNEVTMGHHLEDSVTGMHCVTTLEAPYCLNATVDPNYGDVECCPVYPA